MSVKNIMIVGVGGQGSLLASKLLGRLLMNEGYDAKVSEVHGMSQRGGSVVTYVRYGDKVYSPVIDKGQADFIVSFELLEAARWLEYLAPGGRVITNTQQIDPMPVITGAAQYPGELVEKMRGAGAAVDAVDALSLAMEAGSSKAVNIVLMGRLSKYFPYPKDAWARALEETVPERFAELNRRAFELGAVEVGE
ncbi:MAG: indolepyruvate oxidoreductase subunit beta [Oscillospiraceae bacterium]|nr:indolepyruvate oxidoreductase subunit beta [Oscillospiraceae bacterium]